MAKLADLSRSVAPSRSKCTGSWKPESRLVAIKAPESSPMCAAVTGIKQAKVSVGMKWV